MSATHHYWSRKVDQRIVSSPAVFRVSIGIFCWFGGRLLRTWFGCVLGAVTGLAALPTVEIGDRGLAVDAWLLAGPFVAGPQVEALETDFLTPLGAAFEGEPGPDWLKQAATRASTGGSRYFEADGMQGKHLEWRFEESDTGGTGPATAYFFTTLVTEEERQSWLVVGCDYEAKVWLNGALLHISRGQRVIWGGSRDIVALPLRRGANVLAVKVVNRRGISWGVSARIEPDETAAAAFALADGNILVRTPLVDPESPRLSFAIEGWPLSAKLRIEFETLDGNTIGSGVLGDDGIVVPPVKVGRLRVAFAGIEKTSEFAVGTLSQLTDQMAAAMDKFRTDDRVWINLDTLHRRMVILERANAADKIEHPGQSLFRTENEAKAVYAMARFNEVVDRIQEGDDPFRDQPGLHLRGFRSRIDDEPMHYRLFVPPSYQRDTAPLPLVVVLAPATSAARPFIASRYVADHWQAERFGLVAEKFGLGILWAGYRSQPYGNSIDLAHLEEVLAAVGADYQLDSKRIYLWGTSSAGIVASLAILAHPERYAAALFHNSVMHRASHRKSPDFSFRSTSAYLDYLSHSDPFERLARSCPIPIRIVNDAQDAGHQALVPQERAFVALAQSVGAAPEPIFEHHPEVLLANRDLLQWLAEQRRPEGEHSIAEPWIDPGGLASVFTERFVLVCPTGGNASERNANQRHCQALAAAWTRVTHGHCRMVSDVDFDASAERDSNLVLVGNDLTNGVWAKLAPMMDVELNPDSVRVRDRHWEGKGLSLQTWLPDPTIPGRRIALIGAVNMEEARFGTYELVLDGWFDCAIWQSTPNGSVSLLAGFRWISSGNSRPDSRE